MDMSVLKEILLLNSRNMIKRKLLKVSRSQLQINILRPILGKVLLIIKNILLMLVMRDSWDQRCFSIQNSQIVNTELLSIKSLMLPSKDLPSIPDVHFIITSFSLEDLLCLRISHKDWKPKFREELMRDSVLSKQAVDMLHKALKLMLLLIRIREPQSGRVDHS